MGVTHILSPSTHTGRLFPVSKTWLCRSGSTLVRRVPTVAGAHHALSASGFGTRLTLAREPQPPSQLQQGERHSDGFLGQRNRRMGVSAQHSAGRGRAANIQRLRFHTGGNARGLVTTALPSNLTKTHRGLDLTLVPADNHLRMPPGAVVALEPSQGPNGSSQSQSTREQRAPTMSSTPSPSTTRDKLPEGVLPDLLGHQQACWLQSYLPEISLLGLPTLDLRLRI